MISMDTKQQILHYYRVDELSLREISRRVGTDCKTATLSALHHSCARCTFLVINTQSTKATKRSPASRMNAC